MTQDPTKARLLEAAGEEFAEKGFAGATIRSISRRAGANIAAINYHFGDKERLYEAAVLEAHRCGMGEPEESAVLDGLPPRELIRRFVRRFLDSVMRDAEGSWPRALMLREIIQPTSASDVVVRDAIRPRFDRLIAAIRELCPGADDRRLHASAFSVVGQCLHYKVARPFSTRLVGQEAYDRLDLDYLTDHITAFCLAGLGAEPAPCESLPVAAGGED